jgi:hypothetical protein
VALSKEVAQLLKENEDATEALYHHLKWDDAGEVKCSFFSLIDIHNGLKIGSHTSSFLLSVMNS